MYTFIADILKEQMQSKVIRLCISISKLQIFQHLVSIKILHVFNHLVSVTKLRVISHLSSIWGQLS
jgi:hypothetical protein